MEKIELIRDSIFFILLIASVNSIAPYAYAISYPSLDISKPAFKSVRGLELNDAQPGKQIVITESIRNNVYLQEDKSLVLLVEVRDPDGVTIFLAWQSAVVSPNETNSFGVSWTVPDDANVDDVFSVRAFAVTTLDEKSEPLTTVVVSNIAIKAVN